MRGNTIIFLTSRLRLMFFVLPHLHTASFLMQRLVISFEDNQKFHKLQINCRKIYGSCFR